jgi:uncharacterized membrane protein
MTGAIPWTQLGTTALTSFMASLVEFVEALTVVLAVGTARGWRFALLGAGAALAVLLLLVAIGGGALAGISLPIAQLLIGTLVLLFGLRWLRKAILRSAGIIPLHDEAAEYAEQSALLRQSPARAGGRWDPLAFAAAFKIVMLEGIEVVFIVVAIGANGRLLWPAAAGAIAALAVVTGLGLALHRPLARIPENTLKFAVGVMLSAFGTYWVGEGLHWHWPGGDWTIPCLIAAYLLLALSLVAALRRR